MAVQWFAARRRRRHARGAVAVVIAVLGGLLWFGRAEAQESGSHTVRVEAEPLFLDGRLTGCSVNYGVLVRDDRYRNGEISFASGSLNVLSANGVIIVGLKTGVSPSIDGSAPRQAPSMVYLISGFQTNADDFVQETEADGQGYSNFVYLMGDPTLNAVIEATLGSFQLGYTLGEGRGAQTFSVVLTEQTTLSFSECFDTLLQVALNEIEH